MATVATIIGILAATAAILSLVLSIYVWRRQVAADLRSEHREEERLAYERARHLRETQPGLRILSVEPDQASYGANRADARVDVICELVNAGPARVYVSLFDASGGHVSGPSEIVQERRPRVIYLFVPRANVLPDGRRLAPAVRVHAAAYDLNLEQWWPAAPSR
jgi:hypothetical protein